MAGLGPGRPGPSRRGTAPPAGQGSSAGGRQGAGLGRERSGQRRPDLHGAGLPFTANDVLYGEWSEAWGREAARLVMRTTPGVNAIFCGSDQIARGVSDTLRLIGCRVPEDIALVGLDNWSPMVLGADPPLTSVDMCLEDVGRVAAEHLLLAINGQPTHGVHTVPCRLVARGSTSPGPP